MTTHAGVGYSEASDSRGAGIEAARGALADANRANGDGDAAAVALAFVFAHSSHDGSKVIAAVREVIGRAARIIGGHAPGGLTRTKLGYEGNQVTVAVLAGADGFQTTMVPGLDDERTAGRALAAELQQSWGDAPYDLLVFYDSIAAPPPPAPRLHMATPLLAGMSEVFGERWPTMAGMGCMGNFQCGPTAVWKDETVASHAAVAVSWPRGRLQMDTVILHGCRPVSDYHRITKTEGPVVLEIDGKSALAAVSEMLGSDPNLAPKDFPLFLTLGVNRGERYGAYDEESYANRLCMAVDEARGGLVMFESDLEAGTEVQLMTRHMDYGYIGERIAALRSRLPVGRRPVFALYIDCLGRAAMLAGTEVEEAVYVQQALADVPLLGVYSGVEIARVGDVVRALDWTGVVCLVSE